MILTLYNPFKICIRMNKHESHVKKEKKKKRLILTLTTVQVCKNPTWVISY